MPDVKNGSSATTRPLFRDAAVAVGVIACAGYFIIARVIVDLFPFCTYAMYAMVSGPTQDSTVRGCHVVATIEGGVTGDVSEFTSWDCPSNWDDAMKKSASDLSCSVQYNVEDPIRDHIRHNSVLLNAKKATKVSLVRRVWEFPAGGPTKVSDHEIVSCRAVPTW